MTIAAVVFDMDGVLLDSEQIWDEVRRDLTHETGGTWLPDSQQRMMGMSSTEWLRYMIDELHVPLETDELNRTVVERLIQRYEQDLPLLAGAVEAVERIGDKWPLAIASSSNRPVIDAVLTMAGIDDKFKATVSSEEVDRGKPAPDVYLEAANRLGIDPTKCAAVEDSSNGLRSAHAAGMRVIAFANPHYPPAADALALASETINKLDDLTVELIDG